MIFFHCNSRLKTNNINLTASEGNLAILGSTLTVQKIALDSAKEINLESVQDS
ncbi:hemagglutinin repeat-containing protein [Chelonobacter oris]|uniref:hemagglutinin repeat-containing protein n=1 Tax=Chelonobacter oris TaxID=505317 RepID=UPI000A6AF8F1|nr:hemagglutinin repeat-containing protein [Chelonobacter oris]